jgi:hypothetical protein
MTSILSLLVLLACGDTTTAPPPAPVPAMVPAPVDAAPIAVMLDGATLAMIPPGVEGSSTPLSALLPPAAPSLDTLALVRVSNATGRLLSLRHPAGGRRATELRLVHHEGRPALGEFDLAPTGASPATLQSISRPVQLVAEPTRIELFTTMPVGAPRWPSLRIEVDGRGAGRLEQDEAEAIKRTTEPEREGKGGQHEHAAGWALADLVALRVPLTEVAWVELIAAGDASVRVEAAALTGDGVHLLKPTGRGTWNHKGYAPGSSTPTVLKDVKALTITRAASASAE